MKMVSSLLAVLFIAGGVASAQVGLIGVPQLDAKTGSARKHIGITQSQTTRTETDTRSMSVNVTGKFFGKPQIPYEVQCFFIARNESNHERSICDAAIGQSQSEIVNWSFESRDLTGGTRAFTSIPFSGNVYYSDGSVGGYAGVANAKAATTGERIEGWIIRVVARGQVLAVKSNQPNLLDLASHHAQQLDAAAGKAARYSDK